ncbi:MAG: hypothetical protein QME32_00935 [Endomicrobiia bacterium]|nr:hypothetical protein [Endomicrobiia bacterium]
MKANLVSYNLRISSVAFKIWGAAIALKGVYDLIQGEPEANMFSPEKWQFVTYEQWMRWGGFELSYGVFCVAFGYFLCEIARGFDAA